LDETHSIYVLQFDWEMTINKLDRNLQFLQQTVKKIYDGLQSVEGEMAKLYPDRIKVELPEDITFIHSEELEKRYPTLSPRDREIAITKEHGAVFVIGIGHPLPGSGLPHDERAADYDDWWTLNTSGYHGLNGDILVWDNTLNTALELSSMGIRVCPESIQSQSEIQGTWQGTKDLQYHKSVKEERLVYSIGGGIGIDRVSKWMLRKKHIGEVQVSVWPEETYKKFPGVLR
jgi:aspartate--ammonia ligase